MSVGGGKLPVDKLGRLCSVLPDSSLRRLAAFSGKNGERALHRWVQKQKWRQLLPEIYHVPATRLHVQTLKPCAGTWPVLLPHEVFASLHAAGPELFRELLIGDSSLAAFWQKEPGLGGPRGQASAMAAGRPRALHPLGDTRRRRRYQCG